MAVNSGWVGSQAVAETGQRSMFEARKVLRLAGAGWMSEMVGKSKFNFQMVVGKADYYQATLVGYMTGRPSGGQIINGSWPGYTLTQLNASDRGSAGGTLDLNNNNPNRSWVTIIDNVTFTWVKNRYGTYSATTDVRGFLQARVGRTIDVIVL